jgi:transitional endoplasmic reticulum ATPase
MLRIVPSTELPPRRWGAYLLVSLLIAALYAVLVPVLWAGRDYPASGPLSLTAAELSDEERLAPEGPTAKELRRRHEQDWETCSHHSVLRVVGGQVEGRPYAVVYDVVDGEMCDFTFRDGATGRMVDDEDVARIAKAGGAWPWLGPVNTPEEMWQGFGAVVAGLLLGGFLSRRNAVIEALEGEGVMEWLYRGFGVALGLVLFVATLDVLFFPDVLGYTAVVLVDAAWLWGIIGGTWLLSPAFRAEPAPARRRGGPRVALDRLRRLFRRRRRGATAPLGSGAGEPAPLAAGGLPGPKPARFRVTPTSELPHFGDVGGMDTVKGQLEDSLGLLLAFAGEAESYRITFNGILLHGPPGTGKTYLAKAVAGEFGLSFVHVTATDLVSKYVGEAARNIEAAFQTAAANVPSLLFFDEFDAIGSRRDDEANAEDRRAVAQLLTSLERHRALSDLIVMAATNDLQRLDPAVVRPGRFDRHIRVDLPDAAGREAILRACLRNRPSYPQGDLREVVRRTEGCSAATIAAVVEGASLAAFREATTSGRQVGIGLPHLLGALESRGGQDRPTVEDWTWERLVLPDEVKAELQQVQAIVEDPERARGYGVRPPSGMLLAGPPGTGKTTIARVLAAQARCSFYPVTVADLTSKWVGESEETIARLFSRARENAPSIVFLDEIDAVAGRRSATGSGFEQRLVNQLLAEMDGLVGRGAVFVLAATNRPDVLDPALTRGGRLSRTLWVPLPDSAARMRLLRLLAGRMPLSRDVRLPRIAGVTDGWSGADLEALCQQAAVVAMTRAATATPVGTSAPRTGTSRPEVNAADFESALTTMRAARQSASGSALTPRDHVIPPPGMGGS